MVDLCHNFEQQTLSIKPSLEFYQSSDYIQAV